MQMNISTYIENSIEMISKEYFSDTRRTAKSKTWWKQQDHKKLRAEHRRITREAVIEYYWDLKLDRKERLDEELLDLYYDDLADYTSEHDYDDFDDFDECYSDLYDYNDYDFYYDYQPHRVKRALSRIVMGLEDLADSMRWEL